jgi:hypothetical protein
MGRGGGRPSEAPFREPSETGREPPRAQPEPLPASPARDALERARAKSRAGDLEASLLAFEEAIRLAEGTPYLKEAQESREALLRARKAAWSRELAALEADARALVGREDFTGARAVFERARQRHSQAEWAALLEDKLRGIRSAAEALYASLRSQPGVDPGALRDRVARWGYPEMEAEAAKRLTAKPPSPGTPPEEPGYRAAWTGAMAKATGRDFDGAQGILAGQSRALHEEALRSEAAADLEELRRVKGFVAQQMAALAQSPRGRLLTLGFRDQAGAVKEATGKVGRSNATRLELLREDGPPVFVELDELTAGSLSSLGAARPEAEARGLALFCLLDGDAPGARRILGGEPGSIPPRFWEYSALAAGNLPRTPAREWEARALFSGAQGEYARPATTGSALEKYRRLLDEYADTRLVKSEREWIARRAEGGKEYLFLAPLLKGAGTFGLAPQDRFEAVWTSKADSEKANLNFVEAEFYARPETVYRAWVYAGGCCAETFDFYWQATEMTDLHPRTRQKVSVEPDGGFASPVRHSIGGLKKTHALHAKKEPKTPARWEWIALPLPKYASAGPKKIRLLTDQQGFSIACLFVSSVRQAPPAEAELREEVARARPGQALAPAPDARPWKAVFDGKALTCLKSACHDAWRVEGQAIAPIPGTDNAAQTAEDFGDGELRVKFEVTESTDSLMFNVRQGPAGQYGFHFTTSELKPLIGAPHELLFRCQGASVSATLDGRSLSLSQTGNSLSGCLQFNSKGSGFRIRALDWREPR